MSTHAHESIRVGEKHLRTSILCLSSCTSAVKHTFMNILTHLLNEGIAGENKKEGSFEERPMHILSDNYVYRVRVPSPLASKTSNKSLMDGIFFFLGLAALEAGALGSRAPAFFLNSRTYLGSKQKKG